MVQLELSYVGLMKGARPDHDAYLLSGAQLRGWDRGFRVQDLGAVRGRPYAGRHGMSFGSGDFGLRDFCPKALVATSGPFEEHGVQLLELQASNAVESCSFGSTITVEPFLAPGVIWRTVVGRIPQQVLRKVEDSESFATLVWEKVGFPPQRPPVWRLKKANPSSTPRQLAVQKAPQNPCHPVSLSISVSLSLSLSLSSLFPPSPLMPEAHYLTLAVRNSYFNVVLFFRACTV